jgi:uncharacterized protein YaiL (DUF2058 family)
LIRPNAFGSKPHVDPPDVEKSLAARMTDSLRNQLLGLGFKPAKPEAKPAQKPVGRGAEAHGRPGRQQTRDNGVRDPAARTTGHPGKPRGAKGSARTREDIDLAKAYAIRAQREKDERIEAERLKQEQARERRAARMRLADLLKDKALNDPAADIARHFDYGGKIKRVYVTADQLRSLNAGELGVVQMEGRYLLVDASLLAQAEAIFAPAIALKVDRAAPARDDPYADPRYQVPDDLIW